MIDNDLLDDCRRLAFTVAPELSARPLYVLDISSLDGLPTDRSDCLAWASANRFFPAIYEDRLRELDLWQGPGPMVAFYPDRIKDEFDDLRCGYLSVMCHEAAHILPPVKSLSVAESLGADMLPHARTIERRKLSQPVSPSEDAAIQSRNHDAAFARAACHCWFRAATRGWTVDPGLLLSGIPTWMKAPAFICALTPELDRLRDQSFEEVLSIEPTAEFTHLWETLCQPPK